MHMLLVLDKHLDEYAWMVRMIAAEKAQAEKATTAVSIQYPDTAEKWYKAEKDVVESDVIIFDISRPQTHLGYLPLAYNLGKRFVLLFRKLEDVPSFLLVTPDRKEHVALCQTPEALEELFEKIIKSA